MEKIKRVGRGSYGNVYSAKNTDNIIHAVKRNFKDTTADWIGNLRELDFLQKLKGYPYVVNLEEISYESPFSEGAMTPIKKKK